ncbi:MAG: hypothetical protein ACOCZQ_00915 [Nanoarchaeota archaeon]
MKKRDYEIGAFNGVFIPTFLGIIGVILFLRLGYIVGSAGLFATIAIILLATSVTIATGLSLSSLATNTKIKGGGVYSLISKTLGLEATGSVAIPLYFAQLFSVTLYLFGFSEAWAYIFPEHNTYFVLGIAFLSIFILTFISLRIAVKTQLLIFGLILIGLVSFFIGADWTPAEGSTQMLWSGGNDVGFWMLFALFFPAVTGIIAGVGLSGELREPSKQIPRGLLGAIAVTTVIYIIVAMLLTFSASHNELTQQSTIIIEIAAFAPVVLIGMFLATFSSALTTFVSAPLLLEALAKDSFFGKKSKKLIRKKANSVPRNAILISSVPILITLVIANLDLVAPIITMLFLITYAIINLIVFIEKSIGIVSFRPTFNIPKIIPFYGVIISIVFMYLINAFAGFVASIFVLLIYLFLLKLGRYSEEGDIRQGLFATISEWAAKKVHSMPQSQSFTWKPSIMVPIAKSSNLSKNWPLIKGITKPNGTLTVLGIEAEKKINTENNPSGLKGITSIIKKCNNRGIFTSYSSIKADCYIDASKISLEAIEGHKMPPNILYLPFKGKKFLLKSIQKVFQVARRHKVGVIISDDDNLYKKLYQGRIHVWVPGNIVEGGVFEERKFNLALLTGYRLYKNNKGKIILRVCVSTKDKRKAENYVNRLLKESRFPVDCELVISTMAFSETLRYAPEEGIHLIPVNKYTEIGQVRKIKNLNKKAVLYILDSGKEDVLA